MKLSVQIFLILTAPWFGLRAWGAGADKCPDVAPISVSPVASKHLYLSPEGDDKNACTKAKPCREMAAVVPKLSPGTRVHLADGEYLGFDLVNVVGTKDKPITIAGEGDHVIFHPHPDRKSQSKKDTIFVSYSKHVTFDKVQSENALRSGIRVDHSPFIVIKNSIFANNEVWGILVDFSDDLLLEGNTCYGSRKQHGIYVADSSQRPTVRENRLFSNYLCGLHMNGDRHSGPPGYIRGARIERNTIYQNGRGGGSGINLDGVQDSKVVSNLLYENHASGIALYQTDGIEGPKNMEVLNNTVIQAANGRHALLIVKAQGPILVRNNILFHPSIRKAGIRFDEEGDFKLTDSDYNVLDRIQVAEKYFSLRRWQNEKKAGESHSQEVPALNRLFADPGKEDYALVEGAIAKGKGVALPVVQRDIAQACRKNPPSVGAYE